MEKILKFEMIWKVVQSLSHNIVKKGVNNAMAIVRDYWNGPTHIQIDDTYCKGKKKNDPEVKAIIKRIGEIAVEQMIQNNSIKTDR